MKGACPSTTRISRAIQGGELSAAHMWGVSAMLRTKPSEHQLRCCSRHTALLGEAVGTQGTDCLLAPSAQHSALLTARPSFSTMSCSAKTLPVHAFRNAQGASRVSQGAPHASDTGRTGGARHRLRSGTCCSWAVGMLTAHTARAVVPPQRYHFTCTRMARPGTRCLCQLKGVTSSGASPTEL